MRYTPASEASLSDPVLSTGNGQSKPSGVGYLLTVDHDGTRQRWQRRQCPQNAANVGYEIRKSGTDHLSDKCNCSLWCRHEGGFAFRKPISGDDQWIELSSQHSALISKMFVKSLRSLYPHS
jgi:hypothetical protein